MLLERGQHCSVAGKQPSAMLASHMATDLSLRSSASNPAAWQYAWESGRGGSRCLEPCSHIEDMEEALASVFGPVHMGPLPPSVE